MALWGIILNGFVLACLIVCCVHIFCAIRKNWQEEVVTAETTVTPGRYQHTAGTLEDGDEKPRDMVRLKVLQLMFPGQAYNESGRSADGADDIETPTQGSMSLSSDNKIDDVPGSEGCSQDAISSCSICLENFEQGSLVVTTCHSYHRPCILQWMERKGECPYCRQSMWDNEEYNLRYRQEAQTALAILEKAPTETPAELINPV